ncbi:MAG: MFS transporter [Hungatella sp.]|jgi:fucose permease|nr:MFS transporter [Hungatella sp.]
MTLLLGIIYVAFISLGLPDALLGAAWPSIQGEMGVPVSFAGIISIIISGGTIISSLFSDALTKRLGTGKVTAISVAVTAGALWGFSVSNSFWMLCVIALPYGLGAGAVDAALNNYVALHYEARHMSWLHCFWGVGASVGPYIMGACLVGGLPWTGGYRIISLLQMGLTAALFATLSLWKSGKAAEGEQQGARRDIGLREVFKLSGAKEAMVSFFCYCALELTAGLWAASYMVLNRGLSASAAAKWASLFYLGITMGRFVCGFITMKLNDRNMVRLGQAVTVGGIALLMLPLGQAVTCAGLVMVGVGCAPVYPALLHETPANFGEDVSQAIMGMQMACAYVGSMVMPSLFGMLSGKTGIWLYPFYLLAIMAVMVVMVERLNKLKKEGEV